VKIIDMFKYIFGFGAYFNTSYYGSFGWKQKGGGNNKKEYNT
jgi:hypothetical protein